MRDKKFRYFVTSKRRKIRYSQVNSKKKTYGSFFSWIYVRHGWKKTKIF